MGLVLGKSAQLPHSKGTWFLGLLKHHWPWGYVDEFLGQVLSSSNVYFGGLNLMIIDYSGCFSSRWMNQYMSRWCNVLGQLKCRDLMMIGQEKVA